MSIKACSPATIMAENLYESMDSATAPAFTQFKVVLTRLGNEGFGFTLGNRGGVTTVAKIFPGTPASGSKLEEGDMLISVNDMRVQGQPLSAVNKIFQSLATTLTLILRRNGPVKGLAAGEYEEIPGGYSDMAHYVEGGAAPPSAKSDYLPMQFKASYVNVGKTDTDAPYSLATTPTAAPARPPKPSALATDTPPRRPRKSSSGSDTPLVIPYGQPHRNPLCCNVDKAGAEAKVRGESAGCFVIRPLPFPVGAFAIAVRTAQGVEHFTLDAEESDLALLVEEYRKDRGGLPVILT